MQLVLPSEKYLNSYIEGYEEYKKNNITTYTLENPHNKDIIKMYEDFRNGVNLPEHFVPQTTYWLIKDDIWIGQVAIRPTLNDNLYQRGGHIGYGIKYGYWNKGYGTIILQLALQEIKKMGVNNVLITCNDDNLASAKVIEKNGGILQDKIKNNVDNLQVITRRYWINLK